jgi:hypothetical protein
MSPDELFVTLVPAAHKAVPYHLGYARFEGDPRDKLPEKELGFKIEKPFGIAGREAFSNLMKVSPCNLLRGDLDLSLASDSPKTLLL